jgi:hypothetical protein
MKKLIPVLIMYLTFCHDLHAEDLRKIVDLSGYWYFSVGNDQQWANPNFDDTKWDKIRVADKWENQGYNDYNGYAWYRKQFNMVDFPKKEPVYIVLGKIDDADEVYLNGKLIGKMGEFPPNFKTAYDQRRRYLIPSELININATNTVAVKVYDTYLDGGIVDGPVGIFVDEDNSYLDLALAGKWKFRCGDNIEWASPVYNDDSWPMIDVPDAWENQGYPDYDGYAWYRKTFQLPSNLLGRQLYISLGKIDDYDYVYINGTLVGSVYDLKKDGDYRRKGFEFNARRLYKIPTDLLKSGNSNTIAVRVYDKMLRGGIYEGPIGIMTEPNYKKYRNKYYENQSFWDSIFEEFNW